MRLRSGSTPQQLWQLPVAFSSQAPVLSHGSLYFITPVGGIGPSTNSALISVDIQSKAESPIYLSAPGQFLSPSVVVQGGVAYVIEQMGRTLFAIDIASKQVLWTYETGTFTADGVGLHFSDGLILFRVNSLIYAVDTHGALQWKYLIVGDVTNSNSSERVVDHSLLVSLSSDGLHVLLSIDIRTGNAEWYYDSGQYQATSLATGAGLAVIGYQDQTFRAVDLKTGTLKWSFAANAELSAAPAIANGVVYIATVAGVVSALDAASGKRLEAFNFNASSFIKNDLVAQDGLLYLVANPLILNAPPFRVICIDLQSQGEDALIYSLPADVTNVSQLSVETGVVYLFQSGNQQLLTAVNMAGIIHEFFVDAELMVEDYDVSQSEPVPTTTSFRTHVVLMDEQKTPRSHQPVKIWASEPVSLVVDGQTYDVSDSKSAWVKTNGAGELNVLIKAETISAAALSLWGNFMLPTETIVVYPDQQAMARLSSLQPAELAPDAAKDYRNQPILKTDYQSEEQRQGIAAFIRNTIGQQKQEALARGSTPRVDLFRYLAYPRSMPETIYQPTGGAQPRQLFAGEVPHWDLSLEGGRVRFTPRTGALQAAAAGQGGASLKASVRGIGGFKDFVKNVVHGAEHVATAAWDFTKDKAEAIIKTAEGIYQFGVHTLEEAIQVVVGVLKELVSDIQAVIQWLSYLFDWKAFIATHRQISASVQSGFQQLKSWVDQEISSGMGNVKALFQRLERDVDGFFDTAIRDLQGRTIQSVRQGRTNPMHYFGAGGAKSYAKSQWALSKLQQPSLVSTAASTQAVGSIVSAVETFLDSARQALVQELPVLESTMEDVSANLSKLVTDPSNFVDNTFATLLSLIRGIAKMLFEAGELIVEAFMKMLQAVLDPLLVAVTGPIQIPLISSIYKAITGDDMSILDACALVIAIPTTIVSRALQVTDTSLTETGSVEKVLTIAYTFTYYVYARLDLLLEALPEAVVNFENPLVKIYSAVSALTVFLGFPRQSIEFGDFVVAAHELVPVIGTITGTFTPGLACFYGLYMMGAYVCLAFVMPDKYKGKDYLVMVEDLLSVLPYAFKPLRNGGLNGLVALLVIDFVGDFGAMILSAINTWLPVMSDTGRTGDPVIALSDGRAA